MPPTVEQVFKDVWKNFLNIAGQTAAASAANIPAVQEKIEEAKTREAKNILFQYFPIFAIAVILFIIVRAFK